MIIAVDFDGTLCEYKNPGIGNPKLDVIKKIKELSKNNKIILWTSRKGYALKQALKWCSQYDLKFDSVNKNINEIKTSRKIYADLYIDDKAINVYNFIKGDKYEN